LLWALLRSELVRALLTSCLMNSFRFTALFALVLVCGIPENSLAQNSCEAVLKAEVIKTPMRQDIRFKVNSQKLYDGREELYLGADSLVVNGERFIYLAGLYVSDGFYGYVMDDYAGRNGGGFGFKAAFVRSRLKKNFRDYLAGKINRIEFNIRELGLLLHPLNPKKTSYEEFELLRSKYTYGVNVDEYTSLSDIPEAIRPSEDVDRLLSRPSFGSKNGKLIR
jgi:hypothetical protein